MRHAEATARPLLAIWAAYQHDPNTNNLWSYFQTVLNWAFTNFDMKKFKKNHEGA